MLDRKAQTTVDATRADEDATMEAALDAGAEDMARDGDVFLITAPVSQLHHITAALRGPNVVVQGAELAMLPKSAGKVERKDARKLPHLIHVLQALDPVARVSSNFD